MSGISYGHFGELTDWFWYFFLKSQETVRLCASLSIIFEKIGNSEIGFLLAGTYKPKGFTFHALGKAKLALRLLEERKGILWFELKETFLNFVTKINQKKQ